MNSRKTSIALAAILAVASLLILPHGSIAQQQVRSRSRGISAMPLYRRTEGCYPVEVRTVSMEASPNVVPQVVIKSFTPKRIRAVKIGLKAYEFSEAEKILATPCNEPVPTPELFLSLTSPSIELGSMSEGDTFSIGIKPLPYPFPITKTVLTGQPFLTADDVKIMVANGDTETVKRNYGILVFVAEADYQDGTKWIAENN